MSITKQGWIFLAFAFGLSWALSGTAYAIGVRYGNTAASLATALAFMGTPLLASVISWMLEGKSRLRFREAFNFSFKIGWPNAIFSWYVFPVIAFATLGFTLILPRFSYDPSMADLIARYVKDMTPEQIEATRKSMAEFPVPPHLMALLQGLIAGATVNAVAAFGEEGGWRGYFLRQLAGSNFWAASLFTGVIWGLWHAPLVLQGHNYPEHPLIGVFMMTVWCVLLSPIMTYAALKSRSSVAAALAHGALNGTAGVAVMGVAGGDDLTIGMTGLCGFIALAAANVVLWIADGRSERPAMRGRILENEEPQAV